MDILFIWFVHMPESHEQKDLFSDTDPALSGEFNASVQREPPLATLFENFGFTFRRENIFQKMWPSEINRGFRSISRQTLPDIEDLPDILKNGIDFIRGKNDVLEKLSLIQMGINQIIEFNEQEGHFDFNQTFVSTIKNDFTGDCDNYVSTKAAMLEYTGFDPKNIMIVAGNFDREFSDGRKEGGGHIVIVVREGENYYLLDNLMTDIARIDPNTLLAKGLSSLVEKEGMETVISLKKTSRIGDLRGGVWRTDGSDSHTPLEKKEQELIEDGHASYRRDTFPLSGV